MSRKVLTTGDVARLCDVASRTVQKWVDTGRLKGGRLPESNTRRVHRDDLLRFLEKEGMHHVNVESLFTDVVVLTKDTALGDAVKKGVESRTGYSVTAVGSAFAAGMLVQKAGPRALVVDMAVGDDSALGIGAHARLMAGCKTIALANEDEADLKSPMLLWFRAAIRKPVNVDELVSLIRNGG